METKFDASLQLSDNDSPPQQLKGLLTDGEGSKEIAAEINTSGDQTNEMGAAYDGKIHPKNETRQTS